MAVVALIGDVIGSRKVTDRDALQKKLEKKLKQINKGRSDLLSPYTVTLGDEFQAVFKNCDLIFRDVWEILQALYPVKTRFAFGVGELSTPVNPRQAIGMDGPAFHHARQGIQELKKTPFLFKITGEQITSLNLLNQSLYLVSQTSSGWSRNRFRIMSMLYKGWTTKQIAGELNISTVAVYKNIKAGALDIIMALGHEISKNINEALK